MKVGAPYLVILLFSGAMLTASWLKPWQRSPSPQVSLIEAKEERLERRINAQGALRAVKATRVALSSDVPQELKLMFLLEDGAEVKAGDVVARFDDTEFRRQLDKEQTSMKAASARIAKERTMGTAAVAERERAAQSAHSEAALVERFQRKDEEIFSRNQILESEIDHELQVSKVEYANAARGLEGRINQSKVEVLKIDHKKADSQVERARDVLSKLELRAPRSGLWVLERNFDGEALRVGDSVRSNQTIGQIPALSELEAEVLVLEADADGLEVGRKGKLSVDASPGIHFDVVVRRVDNIAKRRQSSVPTQYFGAVLSLAKTEPRLMKPGKRVTATLDLGSVNGVVIPRHAVFEHDERSVVYKYLPDGRFEPVPVRLGISTAGRVLVLEGVSAGDRIAAADPFHRAPAAEAKPKPTLTERPGGR